MSDGKLTLVTLTRFGLHFLQGLNRNIYFVLYYLGIVERSEISYKKNYVPIVTEQLSKDDKGSYGYVMFGLNFRRG